MYSERSENLGECVYNFVHKASCAEHRMAQNIEWRRLELRLGFWLMKQQERWCRAVNYWPAQHDSNVRPTP